MAINWLDILVLIICIAALVRGFFTGLIMQVATLAGIILGAIFAGKGAEMIQPYMQRWFEDAEHIVIPASYLIAFILILIIVTLIGRLVNLLAKAVLLNTVNRITGAIFCMLKWILIVSILLNLVVMFDANKAIVKEEVRKDSYSYSLLTGMVQLIIPYLRLDEIKIPPAFKEEKQKLQSVSL